MMRWSNSYLLAVFFLILVSCSPKVVQLSNKEKSDKLKTDMLVGKLDSLNKTKPLYFYGRASTVYHDNKNDYSFKTSIKIQSDTAATALITYAGLPIFNAIATLDSVKFQNKRNKCYSENSIDFFKAAFGYPFEFENVVQLLLGLPITFQKEGEYFQLSNEVYHIISTRRKTKIKKSEQGYLANDTEGDIIINYFLVDDGNTLEKVEIENPYDKVKVIVSYGNRSKDSTTFNYPKLITVKIITENNKIDVSLAFDNMEVDQKQEINYFVPASYEICK